MADTTSDLLKALSFCKDADTTTLLDKIDDTYALPPFSVVLQQLLDARGMNCSALCTGVGLERTYGTKLMRGERMCGRNVLLRISLYLSLSLEEAQLLLRSGGKARLDPRMRRDAVVIYALTHELTIENTEALLNGRGERSLYEKL